MMQKKNNPKNSANSNKPNWDHVSDDVLETIIRIAGILATRFKFGYYDYEDMKQEGIIYGLKRLHKFDETRGNLESFLWVHIHNRLFNHKRKKYMRPANNDEFSCCINSDNDGKNIELCKKCQRKKDNMEVRKNLIYPVHLHLVDAESEPAMTLNDDIEARVQGKEIRELLDHNIPQNLRADYLRLVEGKTISQAMKTKVQEAVIDILIKNNAADEEWLQYFQEQYPQRVEVGE